jgi:hypothetical protein
MKVMKIGTAIIVLTIMMLMMAIMFNHPIFWVLYGIGLTLSTLYIAIYIDDTKIKENKYNQGG